MDVDAALQSQIRNIEGTYGSAPGQARGNNLNLNGGLWHDVPASR
jgi:hypothetical protein